MSPSPPPVRFGFVGAGMVAGTALAPAVHAADGAVLQAVAARDPGRAGRLEPAGRVHPGYADLVADPDVDVVYVNLSNEAHLPWTVAALDAGKHVLCEKPLALDEAEVRRMADAAARSDRLLVEALWFRWHPRTRRLAELVSNGSLGRVRAVESSFCFDGRLEPARGGGALADTGCYALSAVQLVLGTGLTVTGARRELGPTGVDLVTSATVASASGAGADVRCSMAGPREQVLRVTGDEALLEFTAGEAFTAWRVPTALRIAGSSGTHSEEFAADDAYRLMVEAVAARVRGEPADLVTVAESLDLARLSDAVRAAAAG